MNRYGLLAFLLISTFLTISAQKSKIEFEEYDLPNGLHVILHQDSSTPIVAVSVLYHVGSKNERSDRTGFAHFFEHLMFEGSKNIPRGDYFQLVQGNGGNLNANTSFDRTFYYEILPSNQLGLALWLESERMLHLQIDSVGVETQRKVIKEEKKQRLDNQPYGSILEQTFKRAYSVHPYQWTPIGSDQYIDQATIDEFMDFYKTYYVPNNATLSISGDIKIEEAKYLIETYFSEIPKGSRKMNIPNVVEPPLTKAIQDTVYDNIQLPAVIQSYRIAPQGTADFYALEMLTTYLSQGKSSILKKALVDDKQSAVFTGAFPLPMEDEGQFLMFSIANMGTSVQDLQHQMDSIISYVQSNTMDENSFQKLQNQVVSNFVEQTSTQAGIAEALANYHVFFDEANLINTEIDKYLSVTPQQISDVAKKYLNLNGRVVLHYLPKSAQKN